MLVFCPTSWNSNNTFVTIYGVLYGEERPTCIRVTNVLSTIYLDFRNHCNVTEEVVVKFINTVAARMDNVKPHSYSFVDRFILSAAMTNSKGEREPLRFLKLDFNSNLAASRFTTHAKNGVFIDSVRYVPNVHMNWVEMWFQLALKRHVPVINWIMIQNARLVATTEEVEILEKKFDECQDLEEQDRIAIELADARSRQIQKFSICDKEYTCTPDALIPFESDDDKNSTKYNITKPLEFPSLDVFSFDIEAYACVEEDAINDKFPCALDSTDCITQISIVFKNNLYILSRGKLYRDMFFKRFTQLDESTLHMFEFNSEAAILIKFVELVRLLQPLIIVGYNIMQFDFPYMIDRAVGAAMCWKSSLAQFTYSMSREAVFKTKSWSSAALREQNFVYLEGEGISCVDLYPLIQANYKLESYKLDFVAKNFKIDKGKEDLDYKKLNQIYKSVLNTNNPSHALVEANTLAAIYCAQDSFLCVELVDNLKTVPNIMAHADLTNVKLEALFVRGTQHKTMCSIVRLCHNKDIIIDQYIDSNNRAFEDRQKSKYRGATVFEPVKGLWKNIVSFDFTSLYPSIVIDQNLCFSTLIEQHRLHMFPPDKVITMHWWDHVGCEHDERKIEYDNLLVRRAELKKMSKERNPIRFQEYLEIVDKIKKTKYAPGAKFCDERVVSWYQGYTGALPEILSGYLSGRAKVKATLKEKTKYFKENEHAMTPLESQKFQNQLISLNAQQLACKICANSAYGFTGSSMSSIPCVDIARCTTYMGRQFIQRAANIVSKEFNGQVIYGDTDSNYVKLEIEDFDELNRKSCEIAKFISSHFGPAVNIEFEGEVYGKFLLVNKKAYAYKLLTKNGLDTKIKSKGILLARRDNCLAIRKAYESCVDTVLSFTDEYKTDPITHQNILLNKLFDECKKIFQRTFTEKYAEYFTVTKSVGSWGEGKAVENVSNNVGKSKLGTYVVSLLPTDTLARDKLLKGRTEQQYYISLLPAHVQLAIRMNERGTLVVPGTRIRYLVTDLVNQDGKMCEKLESPEYFAQIKHLVDIDYLYYIKHITTPLTKIYLALFSPNKVQPYNANLCANTCRDGKTAHKCIVCKKNSKESIFCKDSCKDSSKDVKEKVEEKTEEGTTCQNNCFESGLKKKCLRCKLYEKYMRDSEKDAGQIIFERFESYYECCVEIRTKQIILKH